MTGGLDGEKTDKTLFSEFSLPSLISIEFYVDLGLHISGDFKPIHIDGVSAGGYDAKIFGR